jgi:hypothetical protein
MRKIHFHQFVDRQWHPHPPQLWEKWIRRHPDFIDIADGHGTTPREASVKLFNCARWYDQFCEARDFGLLDETPKSLMAYSNEPEQPF